MTNEVSLHEDVFLISVVNEMFDTKNKSRCHSEGNFFASIAFKFYCIKRNICQGVKKVPSEWLTRWVYMNMFFLISVVNEMFDAKNKSSCHSEGNFFASIACKFLVWKKLLPPVWRRFLLNDSRGEFNWRIFLISVVNEMYDAKNK